jgi:hypothetical protein
MNEAFRLSRIRAPRGTLAAMILLAVVFLSFGLALSAAEPAHAAATPASLPLSILTVANWLFGV